MVATPNPNGPFVGKPPWAGVIDPHVAPTMGVVQLVEDVAVQGGRAVLFDVLTGGTVIYTLIDGSVMTLNLATGNIYEFNDCVVMLSGDGTAILTAWNKY